MSLIVAARFDTFDAAQAAARALFGKGYAPEAVSIFFVNQPGEHARHPLGGDRRNDPSAEHSPKGAWMGAVLIGVAGLVFGLIALYGFGASGIVVVIATGIGAYLGSLLGALLATRARPERRHRGVPTERRHAGVLTAVRVTMESEAMAAQTLRDMGGRDVEQATGRWEDGNWVDFDPVSSPVLSDKVPPQ